MAFTFTAPLAPSAPRFFSRRVASLVFGVLAGALPIAFAVAGARRDDGIDAACDEGVIRVIGRGYTGVLRGLDALAAAPFGPRAQWASIACAGLLGVVTFAAARRLARAIQPGALGLALAVVAAALATLTFPAQRETGLVAGNVLGALLVIAPVVLASEAAPPAIVAAALGLALTYDAPVAVAACAGLGALAAFAKKLASWRAGIGALVGLAPPAWMAWRRVAAPSASLDVGWFSDWMGEGARNVPRSAVIVLARGELGVVALAFAVVGAVVALRGRVTRPLGAALVTIAACGAASPLVGAPAGPVRFGCVLLAGLAATAVLAAAGMAAVAAWVSKAKVPMARASAAMIVLLELAVPVRVADDASLALSKMPRGMTERWNSSVFGELPARAVLMVPTARLFLRARAAAATGALRNDVMVIPTYGLGSRATSHEIGREPLLAPLVRDLALYGAPEEFSLSQLAATRPLLVAFDPRWDKRFARHLVPEVDVRTSDLRCAPACEVRWRAFDRYFVEPRGAVERARALAPMDAETLSAILGDPPLADATADLLRARAKAATAAGERDYEAATTAELARLTPVDAIAVQRRSRN